MSEILNEGVHIYLWRDSCVGRDSYKELNVSMKGFTFRKGFIQGVHMYLWQDSYVGRDSYKAFIYIYGRIHM